MKNILKRYAFLPALVLGMSVSCSKVESVSEEPDRIVFGASVLTKAGDLEFETGDRIGVFSVYEKDGADVRFLDNAEFSYGLNAFTGEYLYEKGDLSYDFFAYYPFEDGVYLDDSGMTEYEAETEQNVPENYADADLMLAGITGHENDGTSPVLMFRHAMSLVNVNVVGLPADGEDGILSVTDISVAGTLSSSDLSLTAIPDRTGTVNACFMGKADDGKRSFSCYVIPQKLSGGRVLFEFSAGGDSYTYSAASDMEFEAGNRYTFNLNIGQ